MLQTAIKIRNAVASIGLNVVASVDRFVVGAFLWAFRWGLDSFWRQAGAKGHGGNQMIPGSGLIPYERFSATGAPLIAQNVRKFGEDWRKLSIAQVFTQARPKGDVGPGVAPRG